MSLYRAKLVRRKAAFRAIHYIRNIKKWALDGVLYCRLFGLASFRRHSFADGRARYAARPTHCELHRDSLMSSDPTALRKTQARGLGIERIGAPHTSVFFQHTRE